MPTSPQPKSPLPKSPQPKSDIDGSERDGVNLAVVRGTISSPPDVRILPSEAVLAQLQVSTRLDTETLSLPVAVWNPAAWVQELETGDAVIVVGRVRRRFFRAGGAAASRVEVEADVVARAHDRRRVQRALRHVNEALAVLDG